MKTNKDIEWDNSNGKLGHLYKHSVSITFGSDDQIITWDVLSTVANMFISIADVPNDDYVATGFIFVDDQFKNVMSITKASSLYVGYVDVDGYNTNVINVNALTSFNDKVTKIF